jgi:hypothetical protein
MSVLRNISVMRAMTSGALAKILGEPALHVGADKWPEAVGAHEFQTLDPESGVRVVAGGVRENELIDAIGRVGAEPLADHAAHRQPAPVDFLNAEPVEHGEHVAAEPLHRIRPLGHA